MLLFSGNVGSPTPRESWFYKIGPGQPSREARQRECPGTRALSDPATASTWPDTPSHPAPNVKTKVIAASPPLSARPAWIAISSDGRV